MTFRRKNVEEVEGRLRGRLRGRLIGGLMGRMWAISARMISRDTRQLSVVRNLMMTGMRTIQHFDLHHQVFSII